MKKNNIEMQEMCMQINHRQTWDLVSIERIFLENLCASCKTPTAAFARFEGKKVKIDFMLSNDSWDNMIEDSVICNLQDAMNIAKMKALEMKHKLGL
ncbi:MAG UNVERIFIED_CONTAM: hypothetical protein LVQ98_04825 [Rickettsiaceae bacterium]